MQKGKLKKIATALVLAVTCAFVMSGCEIIVQQDLIIEKDGSGTLTVRTLFDKEAKDYSDGSYKKIEFNDDTYYTDKNDDEVEEFDDIDELIDILEDNSFLDDVEISTRGISATLDPEKYYDSASDEDKETAEMYGEYINAAFCITFPYKVVDTNGDLSEDGKTVTWEYDLDDKEFEIYAKCSNPLVPILIASGCVVVLGAAAAVVIILVVKGKKKKAPEIVTDESLYQPAPVNQNVENVAPVQQPVDSFNAENPNDTPFDF